MGNSKLIQPEQEDILYRLKQMPQTGSRVYGVMTEESDWDYLSIDRDREDLINLLYHHRIPIEMDHDWYKLPDLRFEFNRRLINVIAVNNKHEFNAWKMATQAMCGIDPIKDKAKRIWQFQTFYDKFYIFLGKINPNGRKTPYKNRQ